VIDTISYLLSPTLTDKKAAWKVVHETLRVDEPYCQYISNASKISRHGHHEYLPVNEAEELMKRTWELVNRFLRFRLLGGVPLPEAEFPTLHHVPTPPT
jgi:hypothetical protein